MIDAAALHRAAERVGAEAFTPDMDAIMRESARFVHESRLADEYGTEFVIRDPQAVGYGVVLGYLAAQE